MISPGFKSAPGSRDYIEESDGFEQAGVAVDYHRYDHPDYAQLGDGFIPYLGGIDLLFNEGGERGAAILRAGVATREPAA